MKKLFLLFLPYILVIAAVIGVAKAGGVLKWLFTTNGVSAQQAHTIDSLRNRNEILDSNLVTALRQQDKLRRDRRISERADSAAAKHSLDSLKALIPDTATMVPRPIHEAIVLRLELRVDSLKTKLFTSDSLVTARTFDLTELRRQNAGLLTQVNSLEKKANPGLIRRLKIALPFVAGTWGSCKLGLIKCD